jgi:hypothetical protein
VEPDDVGQFGHHSRPVSSDDGQHQLDHAVTMARAPLPTRSADTAGATTTVAGVRTRGLG